MTSSLSKFKTVSSRKINFIKKLSFKEQAQTSMTNLRGTMISANEAAGRLKEAATRLPDIAKKLEGFLDNLDKAGKGLPSLVIQAETTFSDLSKATRGAKQSWLLRRYFPPPQERTIRLDADRERLATCATVCRGCWRWFSWRAAAPPPRPGVDLGIKPFLQRSRI
jgi:hypothetical protein